MIILAVDTSSRTCSAAVYKNGEIAAEICVNNGLVHSRTLMPMIEQVLENAAVNVKDVDAFACVNGPGSFTGVRIAVSAVKALAQPFNKPCVEINSLRAAAECICNSNALVVPVLDARCGQVYTAVYQNGTEIMPCTPIALTELCAKIEQYNATAVFTGDGVPVHKESIIRLLGDKAHFAPAHNCYTRAAAAAVLAVDKISKGETITCFELDALYLRKPQAEREYDARHKS